MNKKLVFGTGVVAATFVLVTVAACSSSDSNPAVTNETDAGNDTSNTTTDTGTPITDAGADVPNVQDADFDANSINAPEVTIDYLATCPTFTKCDSNPVRTWKTTGGCVSSAAFDGAKQKCPGLQESNVVIKAKGIIDITATNVSRQSQTTIAAHVQVPKSCSPIADCGLIAAALKQKNYGGFNTSTCTDDGANCQCDVTKTITDATASTYTKDNTGTLTTAQNETYDYCVMANVLTYRKSDSAGTAEIVTFTAAP